MKNRIGIVALVLVLVCVGLGVALLVIKKQANQQQAQQPGNDTPADPNAQAADDAAMAAIWERVGIPSPQAPQTQAVAQAA